MNITLINLTKSDLSDHKATMETTSIKQSLTFFLAAFTFSVSKALPLDSFFSKHLCLKVLMNDYGWVLYFYLRIINFLRNTLTSPLRTFLEITTKELGTPTDQFSKYSYFALLSYP